MVYKRRVSAGVVAALDEMIGRVREEFAECVPVAAPVVAPKVIREVVVDEEMKASNKALLEDVERLTTEVSDLTARLDRCSRASDEQKTHWWMKKYDELLAATKRNDFDQT